MTAVPLLAGLDVGTTHTKAGVYRPDGTVVAERSRTTPADTEALRATALDVLAGCVAAAGAPPAVIGIAGMAETGVPLDAGGAPTHPLLPWYDRRAEDEAGVLAETVGRAAFYAATGLRPSAKLPLARWMWLRRHEPAALRRMSCWAGAADLVGSALTGTVATNPTLAARTGAADLGTGRYLTGLLELAGLRPEQMPPAVPAHEIAGRVNATAAARTGLRAGTPVVAAGHDHLAAAWAAGVREPGHVADSMGTAEAVITLVDAGEGAAGGSGAAGAPTEAAREAGISVTPFVDDRSRCLVSGLGDSGGLVDWLLDRVAPPDRAGRPERYRWFTELVAPPAGAPTGITVLPYLNGRASPRPDPRQALSFHGIRADHTAADMARAVLEGLCLQVRWMLEAHMAVSGRRPYAVTAFGGPTANPTWMWMKARVSPVPLVIRPGGGWAARGAAQLAARAAGIETAAPDPAGPTDPRADRGGAGPHREVDPEWEMAYRSRFLPLAGGSDGGRTPGGTPGSAPGPRDGTGHSRPRRLPGTDRRR